MAKQVGKKFTWVIKDFSMQSEMYSSYPVLIGDCEWYLFIDPKEDNISSLYMGLEVADPESLPSEWRRYVKLRLSVAKQHSGELALLNENHLLFDQTNMGWGFSTIVPLTELLNEKECFLVNGDLIIVAEVEVHEVIGTYDYSEEYQGAYESLGEMKLDDGPKPFDLLDQTQESIDVNGVQVLPSQVNYVRSIFERHPDIADEFRAKPQLLRSVSMSILLRLVEIPCQSLQELSSVILVDADNALTFLKDVGFEVEWLKRKLDQVKEKKDEELSTLARLLELKQKYLDLDALVEQEEAELSAIRTPLSFDDVV